MFLVRDIRIFNGSLGRLLRSFAPTLTLLTRYAALRFTIFTSLAHSVHGLAHSLTVECINVCVHASQEQKSRHNETESKPFLTLDRQNDLVSAKMKMKKRFFVFFILLRKKMG